MVWYLIIVSGFRCKNRIPMRFGKRSSPSSVDTAVLRAVMPIERVQLDSLQATSGPRQFESPFTAHESGHDVGRRSDLIYSDFVTLRNLSWLARRREVEIPLPRIHTSNNIEHLNILQHVAVFKEYDYRVALGIDYQQLSLTEEYRSVTTGRNYFCSFYCSEPEEVSLFFSLFSAYW